VHKGLQDQAGASQLPSSCTAPALLFHLGPNLELEFDYDMEVRVSERARAALIMRIALDSGAVR
jgi:hypothetical protein